MSLETYREKRHFEQTPEPQGGQSREDEPLRFVVQKHQASHLHYDFRLELHGVLKSWAVPKGPSMNPEDKRLAMMVEDHPLDYRLFEGTIPARNYGAGTVMVWDEGTYAPRQPGGSRRDDEATLLAGLERGHLTFVLHGQKLKGEYALVKVKRREPNAWLLIKKGDEFSSGDDVREADRSAISGRSMDEIAQGAEARGEVWPSQERPPTLDLSDLPEAAMPCALRPMLAEVAGASFDRAGWLFEIKWDGYRAIAEVANGEVNLYSRTGKSFTERYAPVSHALQRLRHDAVLDGEIVILDADGKPSFQSLQHWDTERSGTLTYCVFDLLYLDGHDLRSTPLARRKELLRRILKDNSAIRFSDHIEERGRQFFEAAVAQGLEGMIAKDGSSRYTVGRRSSDWLKIKAERRQDAVICGFTEPRGSRKDFGALILGTYEGDGLVYAGHVGTGFDAAALSRIRSALEPLVRETSPFAAIPRTNAPARWVEPQLVCSVSYQEWSRDGVMRLPVFVGMRDDMPARCVHRDASPPVLPADPPPVTNSSASGPPPRTFKLLKKQETEIEVEGKHLKLTNLDKVYWPGDGYRKRDLIEYYREVVPVILPYLRDRPESLHRHPNGIEDTGFFQKDVVDHPGWVETIGLRSESESREIEYLLCQDAATLTYMANLGCIELNPWSSRTASLDRPDYLVIDLDPEAIGFEHVVETALVVREVLERGEAAGLCKTSGATGLHIYVPLAARFSYDQTRQLAELIAHLVHARLPESTSLERSPSKRQGKVYLDYLQNRRGQTLAAPYSVRPRPGAPASTPLRWEEVTSRLDPAAFTIRTMRDRLDALGDIWKPVLGPGLDMALFLERVGAA